MPKWCTVNNVQSRLTYGSITGASSPNVKQVNEWIDEAEGRIRGVLRAHGLTTTYTDTDSVAILRSMAAKYATGHVLRSWGSRSGGDETEQGDSLIEAFDADIELLRNKGIQLGSELDPSG